MDKIWEYIRDTLLKFFGPPDVDDETAFYRWLMKVVGLCDWFASRTRTDIDDKIVDGLQAFLEDPEKWKVFYAILVKLFGDGVIEQPTSHADLAGRADVAQAAATLGMPISLLIQIILMVLRLLRK